jgi:hypothetical protein
MRKLFLLSAALLIINVNSKAQTWNTGGNNVSSGDVLGANNNQDVVIVTQGLERLRIGAGGSISLFSNNYLQSSTTGGVKLLGAAGDIAGMAAYGFNGESGIGMFKPATANLAFSTNGKERFRINPDGNTGIGEFSNLFSPSIELQMHQHHSSYIYQRISNKVNTNSANDNTKGLLIGMEGNDRFTHGEIPYDNGNGVIASQSGGLHFYTSQTVDVIKYGETGNAPFPPHPDNGNLRMRIMGETGKVGIGTGSENPRCMLQLSSTFTKIGIGPLNGQNPANSVTFIGLNAISNDGNTNQWKLDSDGANNGGVIMHSAPWGAFRISTIPSDGTTNAQYVDDDDALSNFMRFEITEHGQVLINRPSAPSTNNVDELKLIVGGGILCERIKVALDGSASWDWPDYVFSDNYTLPSLEETELYIKEHKHLPGIPSAAEVQESGIDLAKMDASLLEKIEELTLQVIQLKKELDAVKSGVK